MGKNFAETSLVFGRSVSTLGAAYNVCSKFKREPVDLLTKTLHLLHSVDAVFLSLS